MFPVPAARLGHSPFLCPSRQAAAALPSLALFFYVPVAAWKRRPPRHNPPGHDSSPAPGAAQTPAHAAQQQRPRRQGIRHAGTVAPRHQRGAVARKGRDVRHRRQPARLQPRHGPGRPHVHRDHPAVAGRRGHAVADLWRLLLQCFCARVHHQGRARERYVLELSFLYVAAKALCAGAAGTKHRGANKGICRQERS